jgi:hypothetical protein
MIALGLILIMVSVSAISSTSIYAGETLEKVIPEAEQLVKGEIPAKIPDNKVTATVIHNTDTCLINCEIILNVTSDIILVPSDIGASFKNENGLEVSRGVSYECLVEKVRTVECPERSVEEVYHEVNDTWEDVVTVDWASSAP